MNTSRQRPVSCQFCRSRKLRCSREVPCSNCQARDITCSFTINAVSRATSSNESIGAHSSQDQSITERLRELEILVKQQQQQLEGHTNQHSAPNHLTNEEIIPGSTNSMYQSISQDVEELEKVGLSGSTQTSLNKGITFQVFTVAQIRDPDLLTSLSFPSIRNPIPLPPRVDANAFLEKYIKDVAPIHPIVHSPSLRFRFEKTYDALCQATEIDPRDASLVLAVCSSACYFWTEQDNESMLNHSVPEVVGVAKVLAESCEEVVRYSYDRLEPSLEVIQALIISTFMKANAEGVTMAARINFSTAITLAKSFGLHCLDQGSRGSIRPHAGPQSVELEIGRRVWWYLAATDWMMSRFPSPSEGTYIIHQHQTAVDRPLHINDEDLVDGSRENLANKEQPHRSLTLMSYYFQRLRLGEICRTCADRISSFQKAEGSVYSHVMFLDAEFNSFSREVPPFFSLHLEHETAENTSVLDLSHLPWASNQRYTLNCLFHAQLCKLHLRYFVRGYVEPTFKYSRDVCLREARIITRNEMQWEKDATHLAKSRLRFSGMLYGIFLANVIFLLAAYIESSRGKRDLWPPEASEAFRILKDAANSTDVAAKLLHVMNCTMEKYRLRPAEVSHASNHKSHHHLHVNHNNDAPVNDELSLSISSPGFPPSNLDKFQFLEQFDIDDWNMMFGGLEYPFQS